MFFIDKGMLIIWYAFNKQEFLFWGRIFEIFAISKHYGFVLNCRRQFIAKTEPMIDGIQFFVHVQSRRCDMARNF
jgi:hypothetical protein